MRKKPQAAPQARKRPQSAHDLVLRGIGRAIVSGAYPVGSLLPSKEQLTLQFKVSNSTLREALQQLTAKGLIIAKTKIGTRVLDERHWNMFDADVLGWRFESGVDRAFLGRLFEIRQAFEPLAAALMARHRSPEHLAHLTALAGKMRAAGRDAHAYVEADVAFHLFILEASANPFLQSIGALIRAVLAASFAISAPADDDAAESLAQSQHEAVVEAIAAGDPQAAADAMIGVILRGWSRIEGSSDSVMIRVALREFRA